MGGESFNRSTSSAARSNRSGSSRKPLNLEGLSYLDQIKLLKDELQKERKRNADLDRQVKAYKSASSVTGQKDRERVEKEHEILKRDYNQLLDAFQRSESIR